MRWLLFSLVCVGIRGVILLDILEFRIMNQNEESFLCFGSLIDVSKNRYYLHSYLAKLHFLSKKGVMLKCWKGSWTFSPGYVFNYIYKIDYIRLAYNTFLG